MLNRLCLLPWSTILLHCITRTYNLRDNFLFKHRELTRGMLFGDARKKCDVDSCSFAYHVFRFSLRSLPCAIYDIYIWTRCMVLSDGYLAVFHHFDDRVVCALHCTFREKMDLLWIRSSLFNIHNSATYPWTQTLVLGKTRRNTTWTRTRASSFNKIQRALSIALSYIC